MTLVHVACCLWDADKDTPPNSRCYDESWVDKLYRGFKRNLTDPFRFVVFTDRPRKFEEKVGQEILRTSPPTYGCLIEPFVLNVPSIVCGLDTIIYRNIDHMARYCLTGQKIALPHHPTKPGYGTINPIVFVPAGQRRIFDEWRGENDMEWLRGFDSALTDDLWPGEILSLKLHDLRRRGPMRSKIIYFHGKPKPHEITNMHWLTSHWV